MRTLRTTSVTSLVLALALALPLGAAGCKGKDTAASLPPATPAEGAPPLPTLPKIETAGGGSGATGDLPPVRATEVKTTGTLVARAQVSLGPKVGGVISRIAVKENDVVSKGQLLFRIDSSNAELARNSAKAALAGAQVQLDAAQLEYDRSKSLFDKGALTRAQWDQAQTALSGAKVGVQAADASLAMASKLVSDSNVTAPMKGVVVAKLMNEGEYAQMMPPSMVIVLQDRSLLELHFRLPEAALAAVKQGDEITAVFSSVGVTRKATIARINPTVDARSRSIELVAALDNADDALKPGLLAEVVLGGGEAAPAAPATGGAAAKPPVTKPIAAETEPAPAPVRGAGQGAVP